MTRIASAVIIVGIGLVIFGAAGDASASGPPPVTGPGIGGIMQGGACHPELNSIAADVSYWAGNGGITAQNNQDWVQCPVVNVTGLSGSLPVSVNVWVSNPSTTTTTTCELHRVDGGTGAIVASTGAVWPTGTTSVQGGTLTVPSLTGGFYSLECLLAPGATLYGYYVNEAQ
jgi:hypothetical protein